MGQIGARTILLVEDEPLIAMAQKMTLQRHGYHVLTAGTGEQAVDQIRSGTDVDLVLMDIDLGSGIRGTEAAQLILAERDLPVVFLSSHTEPAIVEQTEGITSYGYIVKNAGETILLASLRMAFRLHETRRLVSDTFTHSINGICIHRTIRDENGTLVDCEYLQVNAAFEHHSGILAESVTGRTIHDLYPRDDADAIISLYADILAGKAESRQTIFFPPSQQWFDLSVFPTRGDEFAVVASDITERKAAEDRAARNQRDTGNINRIGALAGSTLDLDEVLTRILDQTVTALGASAGMIFLVDDESQTLTWGASQGLSDAFVTEFRETPIRMGEGLTGRIAVSREPIYIADDSSRDRRIARPVVQQERLHSFIGVPVLASDRVIGVMNILTRPPLQLQQDDLTFCTAVGAQVGWAILNARLHRQQSLAKQQIAQQLTDNEMLLRETHHRVKNNIAMIEGLLMTQADAVSSDEARCALQEAVSRVRGIGTLYESLLLGEDSNELSIRGYLLRVLESLRQALPGSETVLVETRIDDFPIDPKRAVALGIILNELTTNAVKHAFVDTAGARLHVALTRVDRTVTLDVTDNGVGFQPASQSHSAARTSSGASSGLGLTLVRMLTEQLQGTVSTENTTGTRTVITFDL